MYQFEKDFDFHALGREIKRKRKDKGWTQEYLAQLLDRTPRSIMYMENRGQHPSLNVLFKIAMLLEISIDQLLKQYEDERTEKLEQRTKLSAQLETSQEDEKAADDWLTMIRDYFKLEELDRPTLLRLVKRIEVGERKTVNGHDERDIKIYYNFVGFVEL